jgi:hypothetical protein
VITAMFSRPFQRRARAVFLQKAQTGGRAGFQRATNAAAVARLANGGFGRRRPVQMDDLRLQFTVCPETVPDRPACC